MAASTTARPLYVASSTRRVRRLPASLLARFAAAQSRGTCRVPPDAWFSEGTGRCWVVLLRRGRDVPWAVHCGGRFAVRPSNPHQKAVRNFPAICIDLVLAVCSFTSGSNARRRTALAFGCGTAQGCAKVCRKCARKDYRVCRTRTVHFADLGRGLLPRGFRRHCARCETDVASSLRMLRAGSCPK